MSKISRRRKYSSGSGNTKVELGWRNGNPLFSELQQIAMKTAEADKKAGIKCQTSK